MSALYGAGELRFLAARQINKSTPRFRVGQCRSGGSSDLGAEDHSQGQGIKPWLPLQTSKASSKISAAMLPNRHDAVTGRFAPVSPGAFVYALSRFARTPRKPVIIRLCARLAAVTRLQGLFHFSPLAASVAAAKAAQSPVSPIAEIIKGDFARTSYDFHAMSTCDRLAGMGVMAATAYPRVPLSRAR